MSTIATTNLKNPSSASNNIVLASDGTTTIAAPSNIIKSGTAVASTSGTSIDFTGVPSWVKRVTVMFNEVSTNGTSNVLVQIGAGSVITSSYVHTHTVINSTSVTGTSSTTNGFLVVNTSAGTDTHTGTIFLVLVGSNNWVESSTIKSNTSRMTIGAGSLSVGGTLDRVRITTSNGTDTFDAGTINILYEG